MKTPCFKSSSSHEIWPGAQLASTTSYKDTGTTRGASYTYAVSAVNSVGEGPQSNAATAIAR